MSDLGWECPRCHVVHAPHVDECRCVADVGTIYWPRPYPQAPQPLTWPYIAPTGPNDWPPTTITCYREDDISAPNTCGDS